MYPGEVDNFGYLPTRDGIAVAEVWPVLRRHARLSRTTARMSVRTDIDIDGNLPGYSYRIIPERPGSLAKVERRMNQRNYLCDE